MPFPDREKETIFYECGKCKWIGPVLKLKIGAKGIVCPKCESSRVKKFTTK